MSLANPKSATCASKLESRSTLLAFTSLCMMCGVAKWCKYLPGPGIDKSVSHCH
ncbi:hypothetical protein Mapa_009174 [Marchantia paleacea]|nr:hypothetical protein Mapa_009174 [Marchantia paleacea]